jgi:glutaryl-CoA dehydrogenase
MNDFYLLERALDPAGLELLQRVRTFMEKSVQPVINHYWVREEFPHDLIGEMRALGIAGLSYEGYGCRQRH